jgi:hypothetical protein
MVAMGDERAEGPIDQRRRKPAINSSMGVESVRRAVLQERFASVGLYDVL